MKELKTFCMILLITITVLAWICVVRDVKRQYALLDAQHEVAWKLMEKVER